MKQIAVVDVETTGLNPYRYDRIIEIAVVLTHPQNGILSELETLINPERDIGPSSIHGLTASDVIAAPHFVDIAELLAGMIRPSIALAGHNIRFDISFLQAEFKRIGVDMPMYARIDTMSLAGGGTLSVCCAEHGVRFDGRTHTAIHDARATARLLQTMLLKTPDFMRQYEACVPPSWPDVQPATKDLVTRKTLEQTCSTVPGYIQTLAKRLSVESVDIANVEGESDYRALLWNVLEDGRMDESEADALVEVATRWGLSFDFIKKIHFDYLTRLAKEAWSDQYLTDAERQEIQLTAQLLGFGKLSEEKLRDLLKSTESISNVATKEMTTENWAGKTVCFTGECCCSIGGCIISRDEAERMVASKGLQVMSSVTKKLNILVVADPNTQSGKARKARQYGIRIVHEPRFWRTLGIAVD